MNAAESGVLKGCLATLEAFGVYAWRNNTTGVYDPSRSVFRTFAGLKGVSDILGILPWGRLIAVETKRPAIPAIDQAAGRLTADQREFLAAVNRNRGVGIAVANVSVLAGVLAILSEQHWARFSIEGDLLED